MKLERRQFSRREILKLSALGLGYMAMESAALLSSVERAKKLSIFHHEINMPNIDRRWDGFLIIHFSDIHISNPGVDFIDPNKLATYSRELQAYLQSIGANPNKTIVIDTGDFASSRDGAGNPSPLGAVDEGMHHLSQIPALARFYISGNHEQRHPHKDAIRQIADRSGYINAGLTDQENYHLDSEQLPFTLACLPDFTSQERSWYRGDQGRRFQQQLEARNKSKPMVIATHTSLYDSWDGGALHDLTKNTLLLHGHTHGGQIEPLTPLQLVAHSYAVNQALNQKSKFYRGINEVGNGNIVAISPGLGHTKYHHVRTVVPGAVIYEVRA